MLAIFTHSLPWLMSFFTWYLAEELERKIQRSAGFDEQLCSRQGCSHPASHELSQMTPFFLSAKYSAAFCAHRPCFSLTGMCVCVWVSKPDAYTGHKILALAVSMAWMGVQEDPTWPLTHPWPPNHATSAFYSMVSGCLFALHPCKRRIAIAWGCFHPNLYNYSSAYLHAR